MSGGFGSFAFFFIILLICLPAPADPSLLYSFLFAFSSNSSFPLEHFENGKILPSAHIKQGVFIDCSWKIFYAYGGDAFNAEIGEIPHPTTKNFRSTSYLNTISKKEI